MIEASIKRVGYDGNLTGQGVGHMMSTLIHENGFKSEWIETQLAHIDKNSIRGAYNHAQYFEKRKEILQRYSHIITEFNNAH